MRQLSRLDQKYTDESPYMKFSRYGADSLSDTELLAIILRNGTCQKDAISVAEDLMKKAGRSLAGLARLSMDDLKKIPGIGPVKAMELRAVCELSSRLAVQVRRRTVRLTDTDSVAGYYMERLRHEDRELLVAAFFNTACELIHEKVLSIGTIDQALFSSRDLYAEALLCGASFVIMLHNHPSGNPSPSADDRKATQQQ